jgi:hypothetical protein
MGPERGASPWGTTGRNILPANETTHRQFKHVSPAIHSMLPPWVCLAPLTIMLIIYIVSFYIPTVKASSRDGNSCVSCWRPFHHPRTSRHISNHLSKSTRPIRRVGSMSWQSIACVDSSLYPARDREGNHPR